MGEKGKAGLIANSFPAPSPPYDCLMSLCMFLWHPWVPSSGPCYSVFTALHPSHLSLPGTLRAYQAVFFWFEYFKEITRYFTTLSCKWITMIRGHSPRLGPIHLHQDRQRFWGTQRHSPRTSQVRCYNHHLHGAIHPGWDWVARVFCEALTSSDF